MDEEIANKLLALNRDFYAQFAVPFALTRSNPQPGFVRLLEDFPSLIGRVLDVGCGNGRFGHFLREYFSDFEYVGVDFTSELLKEASKNMVGTYFQRDINQPGFLDNLGNFDVIACLATLQHIPGRTRRIRVISEMGKHLSPKGIILLANWQFLESSRQRRKLQDWSQIGIDESELEKNDYLLSWQREGSGLRYLSMIDFQETRYLADEAGLAIQNQFRSDGKEGNLNLYTVLVHRE